jgi:hypothetical protein
MRYAAGGFNGEEANISKERKKSRRSPAAASAVEANSGTDSKAELVLRPTSAWSVA